MVSTGMNIENEDRIAKSYRVLARKYRPHTFEELIGQGAMVRILSAAFATGRIAHAYMLTGVRGVGKTTTARLLARAMNFTDEAGNSAPSVQMERPGAHCEAIAQSRHMDVMEMDAASRTGIDDIREIIESASFLPTSAPYKIYIIDEVHMLSKSAFNGLLKILEEPPEHVKFIFATTEIRKVPVTVLSRCQRFDLKRIDPEIMIAHLASVATKENVAIERTALALIARASEGSVRDALSLLDQAIAQGAADDDALTEKMLREMMGLADRERVLDMLNAVMAGDIKTALEEMRAQYELGADPLDVLRDLLELTHWLTRLQVTDTPPPDAGMSDAKLERSISLAKQVPMSVLTRTWQILLKGLGEAETAPRPLDAAEMILVRLGYSANLPTPDELVRRLGTRPSQSGAPQTPSSPPAGSKSASLQSGGVQPRPHSENALKIRANAESGGGSVSAARHLKEAPAQEEHCQSDLRTFEDILALVDAKRDIRLLMDLEEFVHPVYIEAGRFEFRLEDGAPNDLANRLTRFLDEWTGVRWMVSLSGKTGADTMKMQRQQKRGEQEAEIKKIPLVKEVFDHFPDARIVDVRQTIPGAATDESKEP